jgi:hypothetical protein
MASKAAARRIAEESLGMDFEANMGPEEFVCLKASIAKSDEQIARRETFPAEVLLDDLDRIVSGG